MGTGSPVGPYLMLLSQEFSKLPIASHSFLRQAWARPLHQYKIILVDRGRRHLWRMRLGGKGLLATRSSCALSSSLPVTLGRCRLPWPLLNICVGSPLSSHTVWHNKAILWASKPLAMQSCDYTLQLGTGGTAGDRRSQALWHTMVISARKRPVGKLKV